MSRIGKWLRSRIVFVGLFVAMLSGLGIAANNFDSVWHERVLKNRFYFDGRRGNEQALKDISGITLGENGTVTNVVSNTTNNLTSTSVPGGHYRFDGDGDYIEIADNNALDFGTSTDITVTMWIKPADVGTVARQYLVNKETSGIGWGISIDGKKLFLRMDDNVTDYSGTLTPSTDVITRGEWQHVAVSCARVATATASAQAYVNGVAKGTALSIANAGTTGADIGNAGVMRIATETGGTEQEYEGEIAELRIFNQALSAAEIKDVMANSTPWKYLSASNDTQTAGVLTIGKQYIIEAWSGGADDFRNVFALDSDGNVISATNTTGLKFVATATTPLSWTETSAIRRLGVVGEWSVANINTAEWGETQNFMHGTVTNASVNNQPRMTGMGTQTAIIDDATPDVGSGTVILVQNTSQTEITALDNAKVGEIYTIVTVGGAAYTKITDGGSFVLEGDWLPYAADQSISLLALEKNRFIQVGSSTN